MVFLSYADAVKGRDSRPVPSSEADDLAVQVIISASSTMHMIFHHLHNASCIHALKNTTAAGFTGKIKRRQMWYISERCWT